MGAPFIDTADGVRLAYEDAGAGDPPVVLVHGWCCNRSYLRPQFEHFAANHRVIAIDLRGHGDSGASDGSGYSVDEHADDIAHVCRKLGLRKPLIVGHSMGGTIALALAGRHPDLAGAVVMLDGAVFFPAPLVAGVRAMLDAWRGPEYATPLGQFLGGMFLPGDDAARRAWIIGDMLSCPQHIMLAEIESIARFDSDAAGRACQVPALYVAAGAPLAEFARMKEAMPSCINAQTAGSGHFHQLEVPDQVNAMIERFLQISAAP